MTHDLDYLEEEDNWTRLIGRFMLDFASIEDSIHRVLIHYLRETLITEKELNGTFKNRLKLFQRILTKSFSKKIDGESLRKTVKRISDLYPTRNLLAHNSISYVFAEDDKGDYRFMGFEIANRKDKSMFMNYEQLENRILELKECRIAMSSFMMEFHKAELDF